MNSCLCTCKSSYDKLNYTPFLNGSYDLLENRRPDDVTTNKIVPFCHMKRIDPMLPSVRSNLDRRWRQKVVKNISDTLRCGATTNPDQIKNL